MNILSLFDGMSCAQIALERLGVKVDSYFSSEIDKYAIQITQKNYPDTIQLGDVTKISGSELPSIDLLVGGSPCQGFSFAGKGLNFEDPRSKLFFEYVRLLQAVKPTYFLLENVRMKQEYQDAISGFLGVQPIMINSALVSAQNRVRLYWTNIPNIEQPEDKKIYLKDIIEDEGVDKGENYHIGAFRGRYNHDGTTTQKLETRKDNKSNALTTVQKGNLVVRKKSKTIRVGGRNSSPGSKQEWDNVYNKPHRVATIGNGGGRGAKTGLYMFEKGWRKLTPLECERLQTVPDNYTEGVSNAQRYKMLGNGFTVDIIFHVLKNIEKMKK